MLDSMYVVMVVGPSNPSADSVKEAAAQIERAFGILLKDLPEGWVGQVTEIELHPAVQSKLG
jgi:hypothetical protein